MCGIVAVINGTDDEIVSMSEAISHRGKSIHLSVFGNVRVGFVYLPITDADAPVQPFRAGNVSVWMNGYVSNYRELADKYKIDLQTSCDTELLAAFLSKRLPITELNGFFSVLFYDHLSGLLHSFCDRYGAKQLYRYTDGGVTYIASEVRAISAVAKLSLCDKGVADWHYSLGIMSDTIYSGVGLVENIRMPKIKPSEDGYDLACDKLSRLLQSSFNRNTAPGIKTGVLLSGGIDSGIIAKNMQPDYSFSVDYLNELSEIENIKLNSAGLHYTMICNDSLRDRYMPICAEVLDVPKAGSSYTNFAITELASKFCTVIYSGSGADEIFKGYTHRYNREINDVIKRGENDGPQYNISHQDYDWAFLRGILTMEDRYSGWHTMECRYPFLDNDLVNYALSLPVEYRMNKRILKDVCGLDPVVIAGRKRGFSNPHFTNDQWTQYVIDVRRKMID